VTRTAVLLSYRLGGTDGVSIEAVKWEGALGTLGFSTRRVAGELLDNARLDDVVLPWVAWESDAAPVPQELTSAIVDADLVVVENLCSLPLNLAAARAAAATLEAHPGRVAFHHHDLPWERAEFVSVTDLPPRRPGSLHITINDRARSELARRGIEASTVRNAFDLDAPSGDRVTTRTALGFGADDLVVLQPTRAIARKNILGAVQFAERLQALRPDRIVRFWLTGPPEEGYGHALEQIVANAAVPATVKRVPSISDAYAAADVVVLASTEEGFGNPVIESVIAERPLAVGRYPVLDEIVDLGFEFFSIDDPGPLATWLDNPDPAPLAANLAAARRSFSLADVPLRLEAAFASVGWSRW
jgi:hypothetical protein